MSNLIAIISLFISIFSIFVSIYVALIPEMKNELYPKSDRYVNPGRAKIIFNSYLAIEKEIVLDLGNKEKIELDFLPVDSLQAAMKNIVRKFALEEAKYLNSSLLVRDSNKTVIDTITIPCFDHKTVAIKIPPKGSLILNCVNGCNNSFCSYDFVGI